MVHVLYVLSVVIREAGGLQELKRNLHGRLFLLAEQLRQVPVGLLRVQALGLLLVWRRSHHWLLLMLTAQIVLALGHLPRLHGASRSLTKKSCGLRHLLWSVRRPHPKYLGLVGVNLFRQHLRKEAQGVRALLRVW